MTTRHLVNGLMRHMNARTHRECQQSLVISGGSFSRMYHRGADLNVATLDKIQQRSGLPLEQLMAWYRQEETKSRASANCSNN